MIHKFCLFSHPYFLSYNVLLPLPRKITVPCTTTRFIPSEQHSFLLKISLLKIVCGLPVSPLQSTGSSTHLPLPTSHSHSRFLTPAETHLDFFLALCDCLYYSCCLGLYFNCLQPTAPSLSQLKTCSLS